VEDRPGLAFEVASVRPEEGPLREFRGLRSSGTQLTMVGYNLRTLVTEAYNLKYHELSFGKVDPDQDVYYDLVARAEGDRRPTLVEFRRMLQTLLAERFHLVIRREKRIMPVYALVVGKHGVTFRESAADAVFSARHGVDGRKQSISATAMTMEVLAEQIGSSLMPDLPVVDRTGLTGRYDLRLAATPPFRMKGELQPGDAGVVDVIEEQLGLRLEQQKAEVDVVVVERMEKPTPN
jgi:uncharacterized protein (TIGR03435 family)